MAPILKLMSRALVVAAFAALPAAPALAGACASGDVCNIELTNPNIYVSVPGDVTVDLRVQIDNSDGLNTKLIVSLISTSITNVFQGIKDFGYNSDVTATATGYALHALGRNREMSCGVRLGAQENSARWMARHRRPGLYR